MRVIGMMPVLRRIYDYKPVIRLCAVTLCIGYDCFFEIL
jgi:hypothetical protein